MYFGSDQVTIGSMTTISIMPEKQAEDEEEIFFGRNTSTVSATSSFKDLTALKNSLAKPMKSQGLVPNKGHGK